MQKVSFTIKIIGQPPPDLDIASIRRRKSKLWSIPRDPETFSLSENTDLDGWGFSDDLLNRIISKDTSTNVTFCILNVPLEDNYYSRRIDTNVVCLTFFEIAEILRHHNIPQVNAIYRMLYSFTLIYRRRQESIPPTHTLYHYAHHEARGCIFDMNGIKSEIIHSCHEPKLCNECQTDSIRDRVSNEFLKTFQTEIKTIRKTLFFRAADFIKAHPVLALLISSIFAILLGTTGSLIASLIYERIK